MEKKKHQSLSWSSAASAPLGSCGALLGKEAKVPCGCFVLILLFPTCKSLSLSCWCLVMRHKLKVQVMASLVTLMVNQGLFLSLGSSFGACLYHTL